MNRKGLVAAGPVLFFVPLLALLATAASILFGLGLAGGIVFNKQILQMNRKTLIAKILIFVVLIASVMVGTYYLSGPTSNLYIAMLIGIIPFAGLATLLSWNSLKEDSKASIKTISILTGIYLLVSELSIWIVMNL